LIAGGDRVGKGVSLKARRTASRGFTLIELLIVVAIIGIIVAIAVVNMINAIQRGKQKRSMADLKNLSTAIEAYATDMNFYPAAAGYSLPSGLSLPTATLGAASSALSPTYLRVTPFSDGWNSWYLFGANAARSDYAVRSSGADGVPQTAPAWGATTDFNADIILVDGAFVQYPEGAQR
jgi:general secretion pathway protein G